MRKYNTHNVLANEEVLTWAQDPLFDFLVLAQPSQVTMLRSSPEKIETQTWKIIPLQDGKWIMKASCHRNRWAVAFFPTKKDVIQSEGSLQEKAGWWGLPLATECSRIYSICEGYNIVGFLDTPDFWTIYTEKGPYRIIEDELPSFSEPLFQIPSGGGGWWRADLGHLKSALRGAEYSRLSRPLGGKKERWVWTQEKSILTLQKFDWSLGTLDFVQHFGMHAEDEVLVDIHPHLPAAACWSPSHDRHYIYSATPHILSGYVPWPMSWCWTRFSIFVDHGQSVPLPNKEGKRTWMDSWGRRICLATQASGPPMLLTEDGR